MLISASIIIISLSGYMLLNSLDVLKDTRKYLFNGSNVLLYKAFVAVLETNWLFSLLLATALLLYYWKVQNKAKTPTSFHKGNNDMWVLIKSYTIYIPYTQYLLDSAKLINLQQRCLKDRCCAIDFAIESAFVASVSILPIFITYLIHGDGHDKIKVNNSPPYNGRFINQNVQSGIMPSVWYHPPLMIYPGVMAICINIVINKLILSLNQSKNIWERKRERKII